MEQEVSNDFGYTSQSSSYPLNRGSNYEVGRRRHQKSGVSASVGKISLIGATPPMTLKRRQTGSGIGPSSQEEYFFMI